MRILVLLMVAARPVVAAPIVIEEWFLGESGRVQEPGELQLASGLGWKPAAIEVPLELELGVADHLELTAALPVTWTRRGVAGRPSIGAGVGIERRGIAVAGAAAYTSGSDAGWSGRLTVELAAGWCSAGASIELERDAVAGVIGFAVTHPGRAELVELTVPIRGAGDDPGRIAAGVLWTVGTDLQLGGAVIVSRDGELDVLAHAVWELDVLGGSP